MRRWEAWSLNLSTLLVAASGLAYFWMKHFIENRDPFSVVGSPWQPYMLDLHVLAAPLLIFFTAVIFHSHVERKLRSGSPSNRRSGLVALVTFPTMVLSGYGLQIVTGPLARNLLIWIHLLSGGLFAAGYLGHQVWTLLFAPGRSEQQAAATVGSTADMPVSTGKPLIPRAPQPPSLRICGSRMPNRDAEQNRGKVAGSASTGAGS